MDPSAPIQLADILDTDGNSTFRRVYLMIIEYHGFVNRICRVVQDGWSQTEHGCLR